MLRFLAKTPWRAPAIALWIPALLAACGDDGGTTPEGVAAVEVSPATAALRVGDTVRLSASAVSTDGGPVDLPVLWTSSNEAAVTVREDGLATGVGDGEAEVTATVDGVSGTAEIRSWDAPELEAMAIEDTEHALVRRLTATAPDPGTFTVEYWTADGPRLGRTVELEGEVDLLLARLLPDAPYEYRIRAVGPMGLEGDTVSGSFSSGALPQGLTELTFQAEGSPTVPLTLFSVSSDAFNGWLMLDAAGRVVWYHSSPGPGEGATRRANGNFVLLERQGRSFNDGSRLIEVTADGRVVHSLDGTGDLHSFHHDVRATSSGTILALDRNSERTVDDTTWIGDRIVEWDPEEGTLVPLWDVFDFYSIAEDRGVRSRPDDWSHANSLAVAADGSIIVSFQYLDQVISIAPDYQSVEWRLGGPGSDFEIAEDATFSGQHTATEVGEDRILIFDNGRERTTGEEYSRALELELDRTAGTASLAWEFRPSPDIFSYNVSSAFRLENGNTLVTFAANTATPQRAFEVTPEGEVLWSVAIHDASRMYRGNPVEDVAGEVVLDP